MSMLQDSQSHNTWNTIVFSSKPEDVILSELIPWQSTQEYLMTPSNLSNLVRSQTNATAMDTREIVVLEDPLDPNNLQHQTEIVQNVAYSEDVETGPDCHLSKKQSELCAVPPPNKSPRLNSSAHSLLGHTLTPQLPVFSMQTSNVTSTTQNPVSETTPQRPSENETKIFPPNLSSKNVKVNSGENLTRDTVYLLKGANGVQFTAIWNGQNFKQFPETSNSNSLVQHMTGGGGGNTQTTRNSVLQGRGGLPVMNSRTPTQSEKLHIIYKTTPRPVNKVDGDQTKSELTNSSSLLKTSLNIGTSVQNSSIVSSSSNDLAKKKEQLTTKKLISGEILCSNCGISSKNLQRCDRCKKKIPEHSKIIKYPQVKKEIIIKKKSDLNLILDKRQFYSKNIADQVSAFNSSESLLKSTSIGCFTDTVKSTQFPRSRIVSRNRKTNALHTIKPHVPETVTISDDDEPPPSESSENQSKPSESSLQAPLNSSTVTNTSKSDLVEDDNDRCDSPIFPAISTNLSLANRSRCNRMEDELGNVVSRVGQQLMDVDDADDGVPQGDNPDPAFIPDRVLFHTRHLRIGTMDIDSSREIILTKDCLSFEFADDSVTFKIFPVEFKSCECSFVNHRPVIFLHLAASCGGRIRAVLNMTHDSKLYFDPESSDASQQYIVMLLEPSKKISSVRKATAEIFQSYQKIQSQTLGQDQEIYREILPDEANKRLAETCPQIQQMLSFPSSPESPYPSSPLDGSLALYQDNSSPPHMGFSGPVENLITFPPPPAKGGITITNEDFYCLNEGEFLNDVIIDFFLKYLVIEKLSENDRQRTHVFSSFFYKRLTQRLNRHTFNNEQGIESSPMMKRHAQVKTWTRHVDIFEKDFIIVPINENAHWFLAIICFPGMERPQSVRYLFVSNPESSSPVQKMAIQTETVSSSDDTNKVIKDAVPTTPETQKTQIKISELRKDSYTEIYGFKQPCILIFDSLAGPSRTNVVKTLREYLQVEWDTRKKTPKRVFDKDFIKGGVPKVPQQNNYSDCGVYVLQYVESFFKNPIKDFTIPIRKQNWFSEEHVNSKRMEIQELIWNLKKEMDEKNASKNKS